MWQKGKAWLERIWINRPHKIGTVIQTYRIEEILGIGSYGIAYKAVHLPSATTYVMKQVKPSLRDTPKGQLLQVYEARVLHALDHPAFPKLIERFTDKQNHYLVMSHMPGITFEQLLFERQHGFGEREAVAIVKRIAELVMILHQHHIIHRDVRIPNVLLDGEKLSIIDFGLARFIGDAPTYTNVSIDSYPEEKQLKRAISPTSDLYALGHFLLFLLYSTYESKEGEPERSWEEELSLSPALVGIIRRLLQADHPYASVAEFLLALEAIELV